MVRHVVKCSFTQVQGMLVEASAAAALAITLAASPASALPQEINAPVTKIFVPQGFDDNDNVEVIAQGYFPDTCYRVGHGKAEIDHEQRAVRLEVSAYRYPGQMCIQALTPFIVPIKVGLLQQGDYKVKVGGTEAQAVFSVDKAGTESPDQYMYAPIGQAEIVSDSSDGSQTLIVKGTYPHMFIGCAVMDEIRTYSSPSDVLVVLPILRVLDEKACPADYKNDFVVRKKLNEPFSGPGLLHVRVLNGNSLNRFIE